MLRRRSLIVLAGLTAVGCGAAPVVEPQVAPVVADDEEVPPPLPRDAHQLAANIVSAKLTALIHVDRVRGHPLAPQVAAFDAWGPIFDGTGIEPLKDVDRAFVAAANARDGKAIIAVAEHHVEPARLSAALDTLVKKSGGKGEHIDGFLFPAARVVFDGRESIVMATTPTLLVVTSEPFANAAGCLKDSGGLPEPSGPEAMIANAMHPSSTLKVRRAPKIPATIDRAHATITMRDDGGATVVFEGDSRDEAQAVKDAADLTRAIEDATTVKISFLKVRAFAPIAFKATGNKVVAERHVTRSEMQTLLGYASMLSK